MPARLKIISGVGVKGPACFLLEVDGVRVLVDAGIGPDIGRVPDLSGLGRLDAVVISHAHPDHAAALSLIGPLDQPGSPPVHATRTTLDLLGLDGGSVLPAGGKTSIAGIGATTGRSGHCAGGVWLRFDVGGGFLYMGDHCARSTVYEYDLPPRADAIVLDASYGYCREPAAEPADWAESIARMMPVVLPVPAEGRGLELLALLVDAGIGPVSIDAPVRASLERCLERDAAYLRPEAKPRLERAMRTARVADPKRPGGVAIVSNGEASTGTAAAYVSRYETADSPSFLFTGYTGAGTAAARMVASGRARKLRWNVHPTFAENLDLARHVGARTIMPAFLESTDYEDRRADFMPAGIVTGSELPLP